MSRVCVVCYAIHHRVMSQARDDYEGFLKAQEKKEVIVHVETSLSVQRTFRPYLSTPHSLTHTLTHSLTLMSLRYHRTRSLYPCEKVEYSSPPCVFITTVTISKYPRTHSLTHSTPQNNACRREYARAFALASRVT